METTMPTRVSDMLEHAHDAAAKHLVDHLGVVDQAAHQVARLVLVKELEREGLDLLEDLGAHLEQHALADHVIR